MYQLKQEFNPMLTPEQVVDKFLDRNSRWFEDPDNGFFGYRQRFHRYCLSRLFSGIWEDDVDDDNFIWVIRYFEDFLSTYSEVEDI